MGDTENTISVKENRINDLKNFFTPEGESMTIAEWDQLSEEEKEWFREQPLD